MVTARLSSNVESLTSNPPKLLTDPKCPDIKVSRAESGMATARVASNSAKFEATRPLAGFETRFFGSTGLNAVSAKRLFAVISYETKTDLLVFEPMSPLFEGTRPLGKATNSLAEAVNSPPELMTLLLTKMARLADRVRKVLASTARLPVADGLRASSIRPVLEAATSRDVPTSPRGRAALPRFRSARARLPPA